MHRETCGPQFCDLTGDVDHGVQNVIVTKIFPILAEKLIENRCLREIFDSYVILKIRLLMFGYFISKLLKFCEALIVGIWSGRGSKYCASLCFTLWAEVHRREGVPRCPKNIWTSARENTRLTQILMGYLLHANKLGIGQI